VDGDSQFRRQFGRDSLMLAVLDMGSVDGRSDGGVAADLAASDRK